jgi:hypothetical protein
LRNNTILQRNESKNNIIAQHKVLLTLVIILLLAVLSISLILHFRGGTESSSNKERFWIAVTSDYDSPTPSAWVNSGADFTASVSSQTVITGGHQFVCTGFSVDGWENQPYTSYTFTSVSENHSIQFFWKEENENNIGFTVDAGLVNGMNVLLIQNSNQKVSFRFTAKLSGALTVLAVYAFAYEGQPTVNIGLQEDNGGNPTGQWMNGNAFRTVQPPSESEVSYDWSYTNIVTVQLPAAVTITQGQVYHVVIEMVGGPSNSKVAVETYQENGFAQPFNPDDPDIFWTDNRMNTIFYDGQSWQEQDKWPIFVVGYSDGRSEGQPYSLSAPWVVFGSTYAGQTIIPASNYTIEKMAFVVGLRGQPKDNLYYEVIDSSNNVLENGLFTEASQLPAPQSLQPRAWIEATLPTPVALTAGQLYRFILFSPKTDLQDCYLLFGHEYTYNRDYGIGYGGLQHQLTSSLDGGANWGDNPDADAIFKLTNAG